jgi:hypothetical protein
MSRVAFRVFPAGRAGATHPVRAKKRKQTITSDGTPGPLYQNDPGRRLTAIISCTWRLRPLRDTTEDETGF